MESPSSTLHYWFRSSATANQRTCFRPEPMRARLPKGREIPANPLALSSQIPRRLPPARRRTKCFSPGSSLKIEVTPWQSQRLGPVYGVRRRASLAAALHKVWSTVLIPDTSLDRDSQKQTGLQPSGCLFCHPPTTSRSTTAPSKVGYGKCLLASPGDIHSKLSGLLFRTRRQRIRIPHRLPGEFSRAPRRTCRIQNDFDAWAGTAGHYFDCFAGGLLLAADAPTRWSGSRAWLLERLR